MPIFERASKQWTRNLALAIGVSCAFSVVAGAKAKDATKEAAKDGRLSTPSDLLK
jgi:hypothetical protein